MPSTIKIKRSGTAAGAPASLKSGELAYTYSAGVNRLYFGKGDDGGGNATSIVQIGGEFYTDLLSATAGTLTASKALIVDSNSKLDNLKVDNIDLNGNTISSTDTNGNLILVPNGTGQISFYNAYTFPTTLGASGQALVSNGSGGLTFANVNVASTASNLTGGAAGQIPIQVGSGATAFIPTGTSGQLLQAGSNTATFVSTSTIHVNRAVIADRWTTARTFTFGGDLTGSMIVDGSQNVTFTATIAADSVALGTDTTGNYVATGATSGFGLSGSASTEGATFTVTSNATSTNSASTIVFRDGSGNFSAGTITANLTGAATSATNLIGGTAGQLAYQSAPNTTLFVGPGTAGQLLVSGGAAAPVYTNTSSIRVGSADAATNLSGGGAGQIHIQSGAGTSGFIPAGTAGQLLQAQAGNTATFVNTSTLHVGRAVTADAWTTARTFTFGGDLTGSMIVDGSQNVTFTATIAADSVALGTDTTGNYVATGATSGFGLSGSASAEGATFTVTSNATSTNANSTIVFRDGSGNFSAGTITAATAFSGTLGTGGAQSINTNALTLSNYADNTGILYFTNGAGLIASNSASFAWDNPAGVLRVKTTTTATNTTTGALVVAGGVGIGGNLYVGGEIVANKLTIQLTTVTTTSVETDDIFKTTNTTTAISTTTGALQVAGGAGIGRDVWIGGTLNVGGTITGVVTTATNIAGGTVGQLHYQTGPGTTGFVGPGTAGQILVSGGAAIPVYTNTSSIYVGRAGTAEQWTTARTFTFGGDLTGSMIVDGSQNVTFTATIAANSVALGTDTTGDYVSNGATSGFGISGSTTGESQTFTVTSNATSTNATNTIVFRDGSGNFTANVITADLVGTANNANDLTGGAAGSLPYQSSAGVTVFLPLGGDGKILQVNTATNSVVWGDIDGGTY